MRNIIDSLRSQKGSVDNNRRKMGRYNNYKGPKRNNPKYHYHKGKTYSFFKSNFNDF